MINNEKLEKKCAAAESGPNIRKHMKSFLVQLLVPKGEQVLAIQHRAFIDLRHIVDEVWPEQQHNNILSKNMTSGYNRCWVLARCHKSFLADISELDD